MLQEADQHRINWMSTSAFRVKMFTTDIDKCVEWLDENVERNSWEKAVHDAHTTFLFERPSDAEKFREEFFGDSRTVDIR